MVYDRVSVETYFRETKKYNDELVDECRKKFIDSNAFYTVICYVLAIGDRHLDNIMLMDDGVCFHIDFSYILGDEPKPLAPLVRISRKMTEFMEGEPDGYNKYLNRCVAYYNAIRRQGHDILNCLQIMQSAYIQEVQKKIRKAVMKVDHYEIEGNNKIDLNKNVVLNLVKSRLKLNLNDIEAATILKTIIEESASALMPSVIDAFHNLAQKWR